MSERIPEDQAPETPQSDQIDSKRRRDLLIAGSVLGGLTVLDVVGIGIVKMLEYSPQADLAHRIESDPELFKYVTFLKDHQGMKMSEIPNKAKKLIIFLGQQHGVNRSDHVNIIAEIQKDLGQALEILNKRFGANLSGVEGNPVNTEVTAPLNYQMLDEYFDQLLNDPDISSILTEAQRKQVEQLAEQYRGSVRPLIVNDHYYKYGAGYMTEMRLGKSMTTIGIDESDPTVTRDALRKVLEFDDLYQVYYEEREKLNVPQTVPDLRIPRLPRLKKRDEYRRVDHNSSKNLESATIARFTTLGKKTIMPIRVAVVQQASERRRTHATENHPVFVAEKLLEEIHKLFIGLYIINDYEDPGITGANDEQHEQNKELAKRMMKDPELTSRIETQINQAIDVFEQHAIKKRNRLAIDTVLTRMEKGNHDTAVIIYGSGHFTHADPTNRMQELLKDHRDVAYLVALSKHEEETDTQ